MPRVLVVEDSPTQAEEVRLLLEDAGFRPEVVADGVGALASLSRGTPDVIVTDLQMPLMDGLALVEAVRSQYPTVPVVLVTAHGSEEVAARALRAGAASYVPKRDLARDLVAVVSGIIKVSVSVRDHARVRECLQEVSLRYTLGNDLTLVGPLVRRLEETVDGFGLCDRTDLIQMGVALREALVNAIDHGNLELDSDLRQDDERVYERARVDRQVRPPYRDRTVRVEVRANRSESVFTIRDEGPGFDPSRLPDPTSPACLERIGGRGLTLMRAFMDEVRYNAAGNEITLVKRAGPCRGSLSSPTPPVDLVGVPQE